MFSLPLLSGFEDTIALRSSVSKQIFAKLQTGMLNHGVTPMSSLVTPWHNLLIILLYSLKVKLLQSLLRLSCICFIEHLRNLCKIRNPTIKFDTISLTELSEPEEHKLLGADGSSTDVRYVGKPYSSIEVSSNMSDVNKLTNGNTGSYWQSDGAARSHWIRFVCSMKSRLSIVNWEGDKAYFGFVLSSPNSQIFGYSLVITAKIYWNLIIIVYEFSNRTLNIM